jgi:large subunit ribosomal protein L22
MEASAKLSGLRISPRKVRLVADIIRGNKVAHSLAILKFTNKKPAGYISKLLLSAISNWEQKNASESLSESSLIVKEIRVDSAGMLKRMMPAAQGRGHRIRKRSSHVTIVVDQTNEIDQKNIKESDKKQTKNIS